LVFSITRSKVLLISPMLFLFLCYSYRVFAEFMKIVYLMKILKIPSSNKQNSNKSQLPKFKFQNKKFFFRIFFLPSYLRALSPADQSMGSSAIQVD